MPDRVDARFDADFVRATIEVFGQERLLVKLRRMRQKASARYAECVAGKNLTGYVAQGTSILREAGYMAEWRQTGNIPMSSPNAIIPSWMSLAGAQAFSSVK